MNKKHQGFTLVEIMIVVAIIALLSAIAVPNFLRARERSQATRILEELRTIEGAKDQYALENNVGRGGEAPWASLRQYLKPGTALESQTESPKDLIGNAITIGDVGVPPYVHADTIDAFKESVDKDTFWQHYVAGEGTTTEGTTEGEGEG
ncbi:MAG TPA: type II secretion system protein [Chthoniobacteraceae bacterium]|nr:type II secretion system protein [Chthoniobacteraceae bacterium]